MISYRKRGENGENDGKRDIILSTELPINLGNSLLLRWATAKDVGALSEFNIKIHSDDPQEPQLWLGEWTRDLMLGEHPTTSAADFTVVVDQKQEGKIVSSLCLISQIWAYDHIPFGVGRIELVGTDPAYRRRGLVRQQMEAVHQRSVAKGELIQAITGIPWYYRQFGYEMALNWGGGRNFFWIRQGNDKPLQEDNFSTRRAVDADIPLLQDLYVAHCDKSLIKTVRNRDYWNYGLMVAHHETPAALKAQIIENKQGEGIAYAEIRQWGTGFTVREMGVQQGMSWRMAALFLVQWLKKEAGKLNKTRDEPITNIHFNLGEFHPIYEALGNHLERPHKPYSWYIRVPELELFLRHIGPVLEERLAGSVLSGHSGQLRLNFYRHNMYLAFEQGRLAKIEGYEPTNVQDADALFPELTFLQLLFGYRSLQELDYAFADCYALSEEAAVLLDVLFPRRPSDLSPLS
jgi:GNAT superfamily N-acetyltransferase